MTDNVKINNITCNVSGQVTFYWNPYGGSTIDLTPTVGNVTKGRHWFYTVTIEIIP